MKVVQCENGHHYNADKYNGCPTCGAKQQERTEAPEVVVEKAPEKKSFWGKEKKKIPVTEKADDKTVGRVSDSESKSRIIHEEVEPISQELPNEEKKEREKQKKLVEEINEVKKEDNKTFGFFKIQGNGDSENGESEEKVAEVLCPVGWLVGIRGDNLGKTYPIRAGQNTIGRNTNYTIALIGDSYVSRDIHAKLIYEPNERAFFLLNGDSGSLTYLNGKMVLVPSTVNAYDVISFGNVEKNGYMFFPLCGEQFTWTDYIKG